jgi:hypothetical protein
VDPILDQFLGWAVIAFPFLLSILFIFIPAKVEDKQRHMKWRWVLVLLGVIFSLLAWWQQSRAIQASTKDKETATRETSKQVTADVTKAVTEQYSQMITDQKARITELQNQLSAQAKDLRFIKGSNIVTGKKPVKVEVTNNDGQLTSPVAPILTGIRMASQKRIPSDDPKLPYGLEVVIQTDADIEPVAIAVICDGVIGKGSGGFSQGGAYTMTKQGLAEGHENVFIAEWKSPAWTPQEPIVVRLFSERPIKATSATRINYVWP